jgi:hypothetical protein
MAAEDTSVTTETLVGAFVGLFAMAPFAGGWHSLVDWHWIGLAASLFLLRVAGRLPVWTQWIAPPSLILALALIGGFVSVARLFLV